MSYDEQFQAKVFPLLMEAFDDNLGTIYNNRLYAIVAPPIPTFPCCVYQSQDGGGRNDDAIGQNGWEGLITFRSIDTTLSGAWNKALELSQSFPNVTVSGYLISMKIEHPQWFPVERKSDSNIYTAGIIVNVKVCPQ